ncbi:DEAD/DEAH box helicase [Segatella copri]|uniref:DEAD/DEAH box helicase n=1 Tax=Segatella copri TaxID=165179 RepID=UPI00294B1149|nr:type ISP restriction/modification enzyme [Segatella copri]WOG33561.1 type ISP restriction/modification enzyme [Segatella copri]
MEQTTSATNNITFKDILARFRNESVTEHDKGAKFEKLIKRWFLTEPKYANVLDKVWLWEEFPGKESMGGVDLGIDLVAKTDEGKFWAIQCKCYQDDAVISKKMVDSFIANANRQFVDDKMHTNRFDKLFWVSTTSHWGKNAQESIKHQAIQFVPIYTNDLQYSSVNWKELVEGKQGKEALLAGKTMHPHQIEALTKAHEYFKNHDRGKMIMACGTGKTYTSLKIVENETKGKGLVLYMVPSIALLSQGLKSWTEDSQYNLKPVCICSDASASQYADDDENNLLDMSFPASTNVDTIVKQLKFYQDKGDFIVVFSTYQSIDVVSKAQAKLLHETDGKFGKFDYIVCDEAHRTTGAKSKDNSESHFTKIHDNEFIQGAKRLYMTATPRYYKDSVKKNAEEKDFILWSMDDESIYGKEFYRIGFGKAVSLGLLTDYKVLVLTVSEDELSDELKAGIKKDTELNADDYTKLVGCVNGLSKRIKGDNGATIQEDPSKMHRAVVFCSSINRGKRSTGGICSTEFAEEFPKIAKLYKNDVQEEEKQQVVDVEVQHIDGTMNAQLRADKLEWLKEETGDDNKCRILSNVRCLSEGVDVPALDAVIFASARDSQVDVVQSVGRVMRSFHGKKFGYIIVPVVLPPGANPDDILGKESHRFNVVWDILNALRAHDDEFNATVNKINLNKNKPSKVVIGTIPGHTFAMRNDGGVSGHDADGENVNTQLSQEEIAKQLEIKFGPLQDGIYAKLVEKVGDRLYWENWAKKVGDIAQKFIYRINELIKSGKAAKEFDAFLKGLQQNINPSVDEEQAIEMIAQHMITRPVFDALFEKYRFVENNAVSRSMQKMLDLLEKEELDRDTEALANFYEDVRKNVGDIDNLEGKQSIIKTLYEKFFKGAFPKTVAKLGIVYTPVECVDFIIRSVNDILKSDFGCTLSDENVNILDPFVGTGTFITRLLQSGLIKPEDLERKYRQEIFCNEIVLLAYYIADVNIESVFHELVNREKYLSYNGICLTDTFQISEHEEGKIDNSWFPENSANVDKLKRLPIQVIIGNPPYSVGQKSANDNAQNQAYEHLDLRITETYVAQSEAGLNKSTYDLYIKAFRWASDKLASNKEGGVIGFISNGAWLDGNANDGFRKCLEKEFSKIYVLNLRGNARTSGEIRRKEGGGVFDDGSRTPISITILVKKPNQLQDTKATIYYHDIGDYLTREQKLSMVKKFKSIQGKTLDWTVLSPNEHGDWISMRNEGFNEFIPLAPEKKFVLNSNAMFLTYSLGIATNKDVFLYNSSKNQLVSKLNQMVDFYNSERNAKKHDSNYKVKYDSTKIVWTDMFLKSLNNNIPFQVHKELVTESMYRPFFKQYFSYQKELIQRTYQQEKLFPTTETKNYLIALSGISASKPFTSLIVDNIPCLDMVEKGQCFPLYWYEKRETLQLSLFDEEPQAEYVRRDGISNWILNEVRSRLKIKSIDKEMIFYYIYGFLHSPEYRSTFEADLKKSLPRIPIIEDVDAFNDFYQAGKALAKLHLGYENIPAYKGLEIEDTYHGKDVYERYAVSPKMRFPKKDKKDTIIFNDYITIRHIPAEAYDYIVNGKSAVEWLMERYAITIDKKSGIKNDPNDWSREHDNPSYIFDLVCSIVNVSVKTMEIVHKLPKLSFNGAEVSIDIAGRMSEISDSAQKELTIATEDNTLYLQVKQEEFYHIVVEEAASLVRPLTESTAPRYLAVNAQGVPLYNMQNVKEGERYYLNDYNAGKFPYALREYRYLKLVNGNATVLIAIRRINLQAENVKGNIAHWNVEFSLGEILKVENYIIK